MTTRRALWIVIGVSTVLRLLAAASVGAYTNEAYYYMYARHLDWSFFDHPPMVGVVSWLGLNLAGSVSPTLGLRIGFIAMFAGSSWLLARLTARAFGPKAGVMAALVLNTTVFYGLMVGTFAEPDGPLLFFWLLTLHRLVVALENPERTWAWVTVGLAWGCALLSKYHSVLIPAGAVLYLVLRPSARRCLRTPGPYLAALVGLAFFAPVIGWNATHGWASFLYQGNRAGGFHGFQPKMLLEAMIAVILYLSPWIFAGLVGVLFRLARRGPRSWSDAEAFLACQAVPALALFLGIATFRRIMPHWPLIGFVALMPLLGRTWADRLAAGTGRIRLRLAAVAAAPVIVACLFVIHARTGLFQDSRGRLFGLISAKVDPTVDTIRWDQIARELERRHLLDDPYAFVFTDCWRFSSELALAMGPRTPVICYHRDSRSFTFWSRPEEWVGRDAIYVHLDDSQAEAVNYVAWFSRIEPIAAFPITRAGVPVQTVRLYRCVHQTSPFPFGYAGPGKLPQPTGRPGPEQANEVVALRQWTDSHVVR